MLGSEIIAIRDRVSKDDRYITFVVQDVEILPDVTYVMSYIDEDISPISSIYREISIETLEDFQEREL